MMVDIRITAEERRRHAANEWADCACNGLQWLRNIKDGISSVDDAINDMETNIVRIRTINIDEGCGPLPASTLDPR